MLLNRSKDGRLFFFIGMVALLLASLWHWFARPSSRLPEDLVDGVSGLLYGIEIASLLLFVILRARHSRV